MEIPVNTLFAKDWYLAEKTISKTFPFFSELPSKFRSMQVGDILKQIRSNGFQKIREFKSDTRLVVYGKHYSGIVYEHYQFIFDPSGCAMAGPCRQLFLVPGKLAQLLSEIRVQEKQFGRELHRYSNSSKIGHIKAHPLLCAENSTSEIDKAILQLFIPLNKFLKKYEEFFTIAFNPDYYNTGGNSGVLFHACSTIDEIHDFYEILWIHTILLRRQNEYMRVKKSKYSPALIRQIKEAFEKKYAKFTKIQKDISQNEKYINNGSLIRRLKEKYRVDKGIIIAINQKGGGAYNAAIQYTHNQFKQVPPFQVAKIIKDKRYKV